jgi:hypothetical protein
MVLRGNPAASDLRAKDIFPPDNSQKDDNDGNDQKNMNESVHGVGCDHP